MAVPRQLTEGEISPSLASLGKDIRETLQISWLPAPFQEMSATGYLPLAWPQLKPSLETEQFVRLAERLANDATSVIRTLYLPGYDTGDVQQLGVSLQEQATTRSMLSALIFGLSQTTLAVTALRLALDGTPPGGRDMIAWPRRPTTWATIPIPSTTVGAAGARVRHVFDATRQALRLSHVPRSYGILAAWPRYLALAWSDLADVVREPAFAAAETELVEESLHLCELFPTRVDATIECLRAHGQTRIQIDRARQILFQATSELPVELLLTICLRRPLGGNRSTVVGF